MLVQQFPDLELQVYIATGSNSSVAYTGRTLAEVERIVQEVIARHNETVVAPKLVYGGRVTNYLDPNGNPGAPDPPLANWPQGIVVYSFPCELVGDTLIQASYLCHAASQSFYGCGKLFENANMQVVGGVGLVPAACGAVEIGPFQWTLDGVGVDMPSKLLHEIGHVLGLDHSQYSSMDCLAKGRDPGNDPAGNVGVMHSPMSSHVEAYRHWRRDDLDGLQSLYGMASPSHELAYWQDSPLFLPPELGNASSLAGTTVASGASLGDAPMGSPQPLVVLDDARQLIFASLAADGTLFEGPSVIDPGPSYGSPELVVGDSGQGADVLAVWSADESPTHKEMLLRWAVRPLSGGAWQLSDGLPLDTPRLTTGFEPGSASWLIASASTVGDVMLTVLDADADLLGTGIPLGVNAFEFSNPVCGHGSSTCTMLFSSNANGGPRLGQLTFSLGVDPTDVSIDAVDMFDDHPVHGRTRAALADLTKLRVLAGPYRFEIDMEFDGMRLPAMPDPTSVRDWPLALGAFSSTHRMGIPFAVECGNAIVQAQEQCDDGNLNPGDGCDDACMIELVGAETGDSGDTGETGGAVDFGDDGCQCEAGTRTRGPTWMWLGLGLGGLVLLRRRRPCA